MEEIEVFLWILGILFVIAVIVELWPVFLIGGIIWLAVHLYKKSEHRRIPFHPVFSAAL